MADTEVIAYNIAAFICALFVLEFGADKFIDNTAIVAKRTGIPQGVIALLTAGAEWEELAVVVISIARNRSSLAVGNIVGSTISNILGAFSLGLLFGKTIDETNFDRSSKIYTTLLLVLTTLVAGIMAFFQNIMWKVVGGLAIALFGMYVASIAWSIYSGMISPPELSDSDSSDDEEYETVPQEEDWSPNGQRRRISSSSASTGANLDTNRRAASHSLTYHAALLLIGILAVILSAYVLSHAASTLVAQLGISDVPFGIVVLSMATTLPEKFIAVVSGSRGEMGIMVANTVGSNIFLLTLCMGILWVSTGGSYDQGSVTAAELGVMFGSVVIMTLTVWFGARWARLIGAGMVGGYIAFIVLEFTIIHRE